MGNFFKDLIGRNKDQQPPADDNQKGNKDKPMDKPDNNEKPEVVLDETIFPDEVESFQIDVIDVVPPPLTPKPDDKKNSDGLDDELTKLRERCRWQEDQLYETKRAAEAAANALAAAKAEAKAAAERAVAAEQQLAACKGQLKQAEAKIKELHEAANSPDAQTSIIKSEISKQSAETQKQAAEIAQQIQGLLGSINEIRDDLLAQIDKDEEKMQRKDADIQNFQQDSFRKLQTPLLRQFVALGDLMRTVLAMKAPDGQEPAAFYRQQIEALTESINHILADFSVEMFVHDNDNRTFNAQNQEVVEYVPTEDPALDKTVARTVNPGYYWTLPYILKPKANGEIELPKKYKFIFRNEQVACYRLK